jgi:RNA polymerase sigma factor for flagellar operon FliA
MEGTPDFSDDSVRALWERFTELRESALRERLIERYLPLARSAAARFYRLRSDDSVPFEDYLQYARIGLVEAIDDYDPGREASFETYSSYRIRGAVLNGLGRESEVAAQRSFWRTRSQERAESSPVSGAPVLLSEEAETFVDEVSVDELAPPAAANPLALGFLLEHDGEDVADEAVQANPHAAVEQVELLTLIGIALEKLPARERELIRRHYFEQCEFRVIATELAVSAGRVSQLHAQALLRIRELLHPPGEPQTRQPV